MPQFAIYGKNGLNMWEPDLEALEALEDPYMFFAWMLSIILDALEFLSFSQLSIYVNMIIIMSYPLVI